MNSEILREAHFYEDVEVDIRTASTIMTVRQKTFVS